MWLPTRKVLINLSVAARFPWLSKKSSTSRAGCTFWGHYPPCANPQHLSGLDGKLWGARNSLGSWRVQVKLLESLEVMIMLDTLRAINNPLNDYALVALLRSPMFNFNEDDLARSLSRLTKDNSMTSFLQLILNQDFIQKSWRKDLRQSWLFSLDSGRLAWLQ